MLSSFLSFTLHFILFYFIILFNYCDLRFLDFSISFLACFVSYFLIINNTNNSIPTIPTIQSLLTAKRISTNEAEIHMLRDKLQHQTEHARLVEQKYQNLLLKYTEQANKSSLKNTTGPLVDVSVSPPSPGGNSLTTSLSLPSFEADQYLNFYFKLIIWYLLLFFLLLFTIIYYYLMFLLLFNITIVISWFWWMKYNIGQHWENQGPCCGGGARNPSPKSWNSNWNSNNSKRKTEWWNYNLIDGQIEIRNPFLEVSLARKGNGPVPEVGVSWEKDWRRRRVWEESK